ncbi:MAG: BatD family protein [Saprospiraceae bacterium]
MKRLGILLLLSCLTFALSAQGKVRFSAQANAKKVVKGGTLEVTFTLENKEGEDFRPPSFKGFQVISGPSTMVNKTFINGRLTQSFSYAYRIRATKIGQLTIGKATMKVGSRILSTTPIKIKVVKENPKLAGEQQPIFVKPEFDVEEAYIGQQVEVTFNLYSNKKLLSADVLSIPKFSGTYALPINYFRISERIEVINGQQYVVQPIRKYAIFPQREGDINIDELAVYVKVLDNNGTFPQVSEAEVISKASTFPVKSFEDAPKDFTGGVGRFNFDAALIKEQLSTDESTTLTLDIVGTGDMKAVNVPELELLKEYFEVYDPAINSNSEEKNNTVISRKVMTFQLVPKKTGTLRYVPTFTYFDTNSEQFETIKADTFDIVITKGSGQIQDNSNEDFTDDGVRDIKTILGTTSFGHSPKFFGSILFWGLLVVPFVGLFIAFMLKRKRIVDAQRDPTLVKISQADKVALQRLAKAETHLNANEQRAFYDEISKALWGYVSDKLVINRAELSKENIRSKLLDNKVDTEQIDRFIEILNNCELAVFAGVGGDEVAMKKTYDQAKSVISTIENKK